ncbi:LuxR C-terminal-related transcriptional regulator [Streptomyces sp. NPDC088197]|uniref:LuxR C-terminal-related transcriptional regulator n=1 Tax=Streptomyces sp. NPDC088197 TaxID=3365840 RepID=UPI00381E3427
MQGGRNESAPLRLAEAPSAVARWRHEEYAAAHPPAPGIRRADDGERARPDETEVSAAPRVLELAHRGVNRSTAMRQAERLLAADERRADADSVWQAVLTLLYAGDTSSASAHCARLAREPLWSGSVRHRQTLALLRARIKLLGGDTSGAVRILRAVLARGRSGTRVPLAAVWLTEALVGTGDLDGAWTVLQENGMVGALDLEGHDRAHVLAARGALHLAAGQFRQGIDDCLSSGRLLASHGIDNPAVVAWRSAGALGAAVAGRRDLAVALAEDELVAARKWGSARVLGTALRAVAVARRDKTSLVLLEEAVDLLRLADAQGEVAQALYDLGALRAERKDAAGARSRFTAAAAVARTCGNTFWAHRAESALRRLGGPGAPRGLTPQEARIAQLARAGYSNRRIAEALFLNVRTVEFHLSGVYRKLAISGRGELVMVLSAVGESPAVRHKPAGEP